MLHSGSQPNASLDSPDGEVKFKALEAMKPGNFYALGARFAFIDGIQEYAIGDLAKGCVKGSYRVKKASADVFTIDDEVFIETATGEAKTATAAGRIGPVGLTNEAFAAGTTELVFELNRS